ncbi:MAG TPA: hypothetical protein VL832_03465 [Puia sp.]|jgi:hypothetical protein|nr:hypothetical protein [Puia sp.]
MGTNIHVGDKGKVGAINTTEKGDIHNQMNAAPVRRPSVWGNGIFFLLSFALIIGAIYLLVSQKLSLAMSSLVFIAAILMFTVVGAFVLQASGLVEEKNFMKLIGMSFRKLTFLRTTKQKE